ncbi:MAG: hypothetical protein KBG78_07070 [Dermatophilaceae bacterium]|nr:hypothetical protein [Dermatophilaceae bacterium]
MAAVGQFGRQGVEFGQFGRHGVETPRGPQQTCRRAAYLAVRYAARSGAEHGWAAYPRGGMPPANRPCGKGYSFQLEG